MPPIRNGSEKSRFIINNGSEEGRNGLEVWLKMRTDRIDIVGAGASYILSNVPIDSPVQLVHLSKGTLVVQSRNNQRELFGIFARQLSLLLPPFLLVVSKIGTDGGDTALTARVVPCEAGVQLARQEGGPRPDKVDGCGGHSIFVLQCIVVFGGEDSGDIDCAMAVAENRTHYLLVPLRMTAIMTMPNCFRFSTCGGRRSFSSPRLVQSP